MEQVGFSPHSTVISERLHTLRPNRRAGTLAVTDGALVLEDGSSGGVLLLPGQDLPVVWARSDSPGRCRPSSYRSEANGLLDALRMAWALGAPAPIAVYLDNAAVVRVFQDCESRNVSCSVDVWDEIRWWKGRWRPGDVSVAWTSGHAERREPDQRKWSDLDLLNHLADGMAGEGRRYVPRDFGFDHGRRWQIWLGGLRVVDVRDAHPLLEAIGLRRTLEYAPKDGSDARVPYAPNQSFTRLFARRKEVRERAESAKFMWGQLATLSRLSSWKALHPDGRAERQCRCCGRSPETLMHLLVSCLAPAVVAVRTAFHGNVVAAVRTYAAPRSGGLSAAVLSDLLRRALTLLPDGALRSGEGTLAETRALRFVTGHFPSSPLFVGVAAKGEAAVSQFIRKFRALCSGELWWPIWDLCRGSSGERDHAPGGGTSRIVSDRFA